LYLLAYYLGKTIRKIETQTKPSLSEILQPNSHQNQSAHVCGFSP
jgi:hypothetical protein